MGYERVYDMESRPANSTVARVGALLTGMRCSRYVVVAAVIVCIALPGCATNPATGERQLSLISRAQEIQLGRQSAQQVQQTLGFVDDGELQNYVARIGHQLAASSERPDLPWEFHVVDDPSPNAFALPGGFIYITRGMMNLLTSEAELASVLGHEIGHVTARHSVNQISKQQLTQLSLGLGGIFFPTVQEISPLIGTGLNLLFLKYSRDDEREADELGFEYVREHGYRVSEFADPFEALQRIGEKQGGAVPNWLSTHPAPAERVETAEARAAKIKQVDGRVGRETYLRAIDGLVFGKNPRDGFFRDNTFYHPELRIQLQFPAGWNTQNLPRAVVGVAPNGTAAIELTVAAGDDAERALREFASAADVEVGPPDVSAFGGADALSAQFIASTPNGRVRGIVAFVEGSGRVFQLLGYSPATQFNLAADTLRRSIASFHRVTDPSVLSITPNRIDVVQVSRDQTLQQFTERFPSSVPMEELAIINHLPDGSARLNAGMLVKRVVS
jgi:predicted Zn-dependent protease